VSPHPELLPSDRAPGLLLARGVTVPDDAEIAPYVTVYEGVRLGAGVSLGQGAILGRPQQIDARSRSPRQPEPEATIVGDGARVGSSTVVVAGAQVGTGAHIADNVLLRETAVIAEEAMVGRGSSVSHHARVGVRTRIQNECMVGPWTRIEEDVLVSPRVTFIGDPTMGRSSAYDGSEAILVRRACRIGTGAIVFPPAEIGEEAVVGAGAMVRGDVEPRTVVVGVPARVLRPVADDETIEAWRS
jgi:acetyltransferase-like isoleucine patch superfamily enzyme